MAVVMSRAEVREAVRGAIVVNMPVADAHIDQARSSMPIYLDDFMALVVAAGEWLIAEDAEADRLDGERSLAEARDRLALDEIGMD